VRNNAEILLLAKNVAWSSTGVVLAQVVTLLSYMLLARYIGKEPFGQFTIIQSTANAVSTFAGLGLAVTATKYIAELRLRDPVRAGSTFTLIAMITVLWTGLLAVVIWIAAPQIATEVLKRSELVSAVRIGSILLFFTTLMNVQNGALAGFESFDAAAKTSMLRGFLILPFLLLGAAMGGVSGAVLGFAMASAVTCTINQGLLWRRCKIHSMVLSLRGGLKEIRFLAVFSIPALLTNIVPAPCLALAQTLLIRQPGGYGSLAVFTAAFQLRTGIVLLPALLSQPLVPMLARSSGSPLSSRRGLMRATCVATLAVSVPLAGIVCCFPKYLMLAYGRSFAGNTPVLMLLAVSAVVSSMTNPFTAAVISSGRMWTLSLAYAAWGAVFLSVTYTLLPALQGTALSVAFVASDSVQAAAVLALYWRLEREQTCTLNMNSAGAA
jgi:O-antigen/teichoic acid export membrane protein